MKKRVLSLFMALALCFSMLPTAALAEEAGAAPDAANADSTYTNGEDAGLAGGEDDSVPDDTDGGDTGSSGEAHDGEADTAVSAVQEAHHANHCVNDGNTELAIVTAKNGGKLSLSNGAFSRVDVMNDGSSASLSGGSYGEITSGNDYVKPYALLAKGYAYKKTKDNQWIPNANSIPSEVTVEKAPFAVEKIYPNSDTNYTENSAFATDGKITLTAVIAPETQGVTYTYWWELFNESENDWTTQFSKVNAATHTGGKSKTLTISGLPVDKSYQYHIFVQCDNGYQCYSEPFTVTQHQHSWTYSASGATITAKCTAGAAK